MATLDSHLSDKDLLLFVDGELSGRRAANARNHLSACWNCRARMAKMEGTIVDFTRAYYESSENKPPSPAGPRALLSVRLADLTSKHGPSERLYFWLFSSAKRVFAVGLAICATAFIGRSVWHYAASRGAARDALMERRILPDSNLTPGLVRAASLEDLCSNEHEEVVGQINAPLRKAVMDEYGLANTRANDYEIDYLVTPGLGGKEDIRNLWPQPYSARIWNAYAKDQLEERLHRMVCNRELDLAEAQQDIARDWIAAYKKYFKTNEPSTVSSLETH